jgi:formylglycine-generating enzyme required for sulfatase activity
MNGGGMLVWENVFGSWIGWNERDRSILRAMIAIQRPRLYPWGDEPREGVGNEGRTRSTTPVRSFPNGRSPFGLYDCCGNVWQWTESERSDGRTRFCSLKGGSFYEARGSDWYADGGLKPCRFAAKFLLMWPGLDRCATVGFRCALGLGG